MATFIKCDFCGDFIPERDNFFELSIDGGFVDDSFDICPICRERVLSLKDTDNEKE